MAGYGNADDHIEAQQNHIEDALALNRFLARRDTRPVAPPGPVACLRCGAEIPDRRLAAAPGCRFCIDCQTLEEESRRSAAAHICRNTYTP